MPALERPFAPGGRTSTPTTVPAPLKGWNTRDPVANMKPEFALVLDNWIPREAKIEVRAGQTRWTTSGVAGKILGSFLKYTGTSGQKLFATADNGDIYNVSATGALPAAETLEDAITSHFGWQFVNFGTTGGQFMIAAVGGEALQYYDGAAWHTVDGTSAPYAITGPSTSDLVVPNVWKRRVWFIKRTSLDAYYLPVNAIAGVATVFPLGPLFSKGGVLVSQGTWTIDSGEGADDHLVFITSEGQVAVYKGTDPAVDMALVGLYNIAKPVGGRPIIKYGGDLLVITEQGIVPMAQAIQTATVTNKKQITDRIAPSFVAAANAFRASDGWCLTLHSADNLLVANIPQGSTFHQYVMNTITGAWCRFLGHNGYDWIDFNDKLMYLHSSFGVVRALVGTADFEADVGSEIRFAFSYMGQQNSVQNKHWKLCRPQLTVSAPIRLRIALAVDYDSNPVFQDASMDALIALLQQSVWNGAIWDASVWGFDEFTSLEWQTLVAYPGFCGSFGMQTFSKVADVALTALDVIYEPGYSI